jgi:hypothetical protein
MPVLVSRATRAILTLRRSRRGSASQEQTFLESETPPEVAAEERPEEDIELAVALSLEAHRMDRAQEDSQLSEAILASQVSAEEEEELRALLDRELKEALQASQASTAGIEADYHEDQELAAALATFRATLLSGEQEVGERRPMLVAEGQASSVEGTDVANGPVEFDLAMADGATQTLDVFGDRGVGSTQTLDGLALWWDPEVTCEEASSEDAVAACVAVGEEQVPLLRSLPPTVGGA